MELFLYIPELIQISSTFANKIVSIVIFCFLWQSFPKNFSILDYQITVCYSGLEETWLNTQDFYAEWFHTYPASQKQSGNSLYMFEKG